MNTLKEPKVISNTEIATFFGKLFAFNSGLKLYHWHVTGVGSYAKHIAIDQALASLLDVTDRIVETSYATFGDLDIHIPETNRPSDLIKYCESFYTTIELGRELFEAAFIQSILDDYQEAIQQLLFRLKRLQ